MNSFLKKCCALMALTILPAGALLGVVFSADANAVTTQNSSRLFTDIDSSFARGDIESFALRGIVEGFRDGSFRPNNSITRAEFLAITMNALNISVDGITETVFQDIPTGDGVWIMFYAQRAQQLGIAYGQTIGGILKFRPNDAITRAEAIIMLLRAANIPVDLGLETTDFQDIQNYAGGAMIPYVEKAQQLGIIDGQMIGGLLKFRPNDSITRAESVKIIMQASSL